MLPVHWWHLPLVAAHWAGRLDTINHLCQPRNPESWAFFVLYQLLVGLAALKWLVHDSWGTCEPAVQMTRRKMSVNSYVRSYYLCFQATFWKYLDCNVCFIADVIILFSWQSIRFKCTWELPNPENLQPQLMASSRFPSTIFVWHLCKCKLQLLLSSRLLLREVLAVIAVVRIERFLSYPIHEIGCPGNSWFGQLDFSVK